MTPPPDAKPQKIIIVGAGFSGTAVALNLVRAAKGPIEITLVEKTDTFGPGIAYGTREDIYLLNVPASRMGLFVDEPTHFLEWATKNRPRLPAGLFPEKLLPTTYLPRRLYGLYLVELLESAGDSIRRIHGEVVGVKVGSSGRASLKLNDGGEIEGDRVVFAPGNLAPRWPREFSRTMSDERRCVSLWEPEKMLAIPKEARVLILGTGLTMVDVLVFLERRGHTGKIFAFSRHGLLPEVHTVADPLPPFYEAGRGPKSIRKIVSDLRDEVRNAVKNQKPWQPVVDAMRASTPSVWAELPLAEKKLFLRHVRAPWQVIGHRIPPEVSQKVKGLIASGRLEVFGGRITGVKEDPDGFSISLRPRKANAEKSLSVDYLINCIGPAQAFAKGTSPIVDSLIQAEFAVHDPTGLGLHLDPEGAIIAADGRPSTIFFTVGSLRRGMLWETTAVPEIRVQAQKLAVHLLAIHGETP